MGEKATLLIYCPDQVGIVATVTEFIQKNNGNIVSLDQHIDIEEDYFFMRVEWDLESFSVPRDKLNDYFKTLIGDRFKMNFKIYFSDNKPKMALFVTKLTHCFYDILGRTQSGEWNLEVPLIISNHEYLRSIADKFGIPFYHIPITKENKVEQEKVQLKLLKEYEIDFVVLARYMQIISPQLIEVFPSQIINIHHSFLPAFPGAKPYHSAYERGVKVIGATAHYVTEELDCGPILEQDVTQISHKNSVKDLIRKGQDLEKVVLSRAIYNHLERKSLVFRNKTVIFD